MNQPHSFNLISIIIFMVSATLSMSAASAANISGEVIIEVQNEYTNKSDDATVDETNNLFLRTEVAPTIEFSEQLFVDGVIVLESIHDPQPYDDNAFDDEGIFIEEIKLNYSMGSMTAFAGKFNPGFGIAWDFGRGIWSEDFAEDYEITEKLGLGISLTCDNGPMGQHTLTVSSFFADTSFLSSSTITKRDTLDKDDGGAANTEDLSSFVIALEGESLAGIEPLYYKLGYRHLATSDVNPGIDDETGYVATLGHTFTNSENITFDALIEFVSIDNFETGADDYQYLTASVITTLNEQWNLTLGHTARDIDEAAGTEVNDKLLQASIGYDFGQGTTAEFGVKSTEEANSDTDIIGGLIRHTFEF